MPSIFLIAPAYFNYHEIIIKTLESKGFEVTFFPDQNEGLSYIVSTKSNFFLKRHKNQLFKKLRRVFDEKEFDYLFVIGGKTINEEFWQYLATKHKVKKVLYQWDSLKNFNYKNLIPIFDKVATFDRLDSTNLNINYLPLFYQKSIVKENIPTDIDLLFIGIWHSDRIEILNKIVDFAKANGLTYYVKVYYSWYVYLYMVYVKKRPIKSDFFVFRKIPLSQTLQYYERCKVIVDINHPNQTGLTMRTIEAVGKGKKIISTNQYIKYEDFYNKKMIFLIDRDQPQLDLDFFRSEGNYKNIDNLEISNWLDNLLTITS